MTETTENQDDRLKRLIFRSCHMGMVENDILFGEFSRSELSSLDDRQLDDYEILMGLPDNDLYNWITGKDPLPEGSEREVLILIKKFNKTD